MGSSNKVEPQAQIVLASSDLTQDMDFFSGLGFRLINIFPDDDPEVAVMACFGLNIRLDKKSNAAEATIHILTDEPELVADGKKEIIAPNGTKVKVMPKSYEVVSPPTQHKFEVRQLRDKEPWVIGRAGMLYRDLIPDRLGGSIMASHIRIPKGGPVPDMVHFHTIGFQLIFCYHGWVKLVYEDQGPPFILKAGDCVTQPPEIRHRVLEASDNLEVIEIGVPAAHMTTIDHDMVLPTKDYRPDREFQGQRFCHHKKEEAEWLPWNADGFEYRETGIAEATKGIESVQVARFAKSGSAPQPTIHNADILFTFVKQGKLTLEADNQETQNLNKGDAFVIPPDLNYQFRNCSEDLELLEVRLPGRRPKECQGIEILQ